MKALAISPRLDIRPTTQTLDIWGRAECIFPSGLLRSNIQSLFRMREPKEDGEKDEIVVREGYPFTQKVI